MLQFNLNETHWLVNFLIDTVSTDDLNKCWVKNKTTEYMDLNKVSEILSKYQIKSFVKGKKTLTVEIAPKDALFLMLKYG